MKNTQDKKESLINILDQYNHTNFESRTLAKHAVLTKQLSMNPNSQSVNKNPKETAKLIALHEIYKIKGI